MGFGRFDPNLLAVTIQGRLEHRVGGVVRRVIAELKMPSDLRTLAEQVPVYCEWEMAEHWVEEGVADDTMGLFNDKVLLCEIKMSKV